jgi:hypothetical protein
VAILCSDSSGAGDREQSTHLLIVLTLRLPVVNLKLKLKRFDRSGFLNTSFLRSDFFLQCRI